MARRQKLRRNRKGTRRRGGGYSLGPDSVNPGNQVVHAFAGAAKDCPPDQPMYRYGEITSFSPKGLPGMSGGTRLAVAEHLPYGPAIPSAPIAPVVPSSAQKGGAYGTVLSPLNPDNGVGSSALPTTQSIPCALRYPPTMRGGSAAVIPDRVEVGAADMMAYRAPNAGYTNQAMLIPGGATPAVMNPVGYPAGSFNRACLTTGGAAPVMHPAASDLGNRMDFDGSSGSLPVKYGGGKRRSLRKTRRDRRNRKTRRDRRKSRRNRRRSL